MIMYVIYKQPSDYPKNYVVRRWVNDIPDKEPHAVVDTWEEARKTIPKGKFCIHGLGNEDPVIIETWI